MKNLLFCSLFLAFSCVFVRNTPLFMYLCPRNIQLFLLMKPFKYFLLALFPLLDTTSTWAQTDITTQYLTNPSFEADTWVCTDGVKQSESSDGLRGWDVSFVPGWTTTRPDKQLLITADCFTDNNFGKTSIADGTYALFQRNGWSDNSSRIYTGTINALPAGNYILRFLKLLFF